MTNQHCDTTQGTCQPTPPSNAESDCCDMPEKLLALADEAWMEVMKEKIKAEIQTSCGDHMNKVAKLVAETNKARWGHLITGKQRCQEYQHNLHQLMAECSNK